MGTANDRPKPNGEDLGGLGCRTVSLIIQNLERARRRTPLCVRAKNLYLSPCAPPHCGQYRQAAGLGAAGQFSLLKRLPEPIVHAGFDDVLIFPDRNGHLGP
jgi:hypothetical protein